MAAVWAIQKCRHWLYGSPKFELIMDHQPLVGIFKKELGDIPNRSLQRFRERVLDYAFDTKWVEGKGHLIADALSISAADDAIEKILALPIIQSLDSQLDSLHQAAMESESYHRLFKAVSTLTPKQACRLSSAHLVAPYKPAWNELSIHTDSKLVLYHTDQIVMPVSERGRILDLLHWGHSCIGKTCALARQHYYGLGMNNSMCQVVEACHECVCILPQQPAQPLTQTLAYYLMHHMSTNLFQQGRQHYLAFADNSRASSGVTA